MKQKYTEIIDFLLRTQGVDVSKYDESFLEKAFQKRFTETNCNTGKAYYNYIEENERERNQFIESLNISYSEFFRNPLTFAVLDKNILPAIELSNKNNQRKEIRIWSAACASGQETYSLAILFEEHKNGDTEKNNFRIFATDQNELQIDKARIGQFPKSSLNKLTLKRFDQWFFQEGDTFSIKPELKINIDFSVFDLLHEQLSSPPASIFGDFDLVVCANLLFYYKPEYQKKIIHKTSNCLANGGYLITSETEREILLKYNYREVFPQSAIFQKI